MVRSLWSAATGMNAQQTNVDTISNNLANVNTVGYKAQGAQFKSLLYQELHLKPKPKAWDVSATNCKEASLSVNFSKASFKA